MLPFEGRTLGLDPESLSPADMLEARTNGILVWYLDQLALLVDQSVALLEEVAAKVRVLSARRSARSILSEWNLVSEAQQSWARTKALRT